MLYVFCKYTPGGFVPSPSFVFTDAFMFGLKLSFCSTDHSVGFVNYVQ